jgi:hypothetical protein
MARMIPKTVNHTVDDGVRRTSGCLIEQRGVLVAIRGGGVVLDMVGEREFLFSSREIYTKGCKV